VTDYLFFDTASTTKCCEAAVQLIQKFAVEEFGNPSSNHLYGQKAARAIREARLFFADHFQVEPEQVVFTGSGSESDNFAIYGVVTGRLAEAREQNQAHPRLRVLTSEIEHPAVRKTVESLEALGVETRFFPIHQTGEVNWPQFLDLLAPWTALVSVQQVNNIIGAILPVEELARKAKEKIPDLIFHTDAVQSFGKIKVPDSSSPIDLVSISGHKIEGPKGVGALIILNKKFLRSGLRPLIWGGEQEHGFRSGTQSAGLIAGFHAAAKIALHHQQLHLEKVMNLKNHFRQLLRERGLLNPESKNSLIRWNSPENSVPHIVSLGIPGYPAGPLSRLLEERKCLVSVGSACSSKKIEPDPILSAMGFPPEVQTSSLRISFSHHFSFQDLETLVDALAESIQRMSLLLGKSPGRKKQL
jgi:cysteine desulfurase